MRYIWRIKFYYSRKIRMSGWALTTSNFYFLICCIFKFQYHIYNIMLIFSKLMPLTSKYLVLVKKKIKQFLPISKIWIVLMLLVIMIKHLLDLCYLFMVRFCALYLKLQFEYDISVSNMSYGFVNFNYIVCDSFIAQAEIPPFVFKHFWSAYL